MLQSDKYFTTDGELIEWLYLFEIFCCFDAWTHEGVMWELTQGTHTPANERHCQEAIKLMLSTLSDTADRVNGNGWRLTKFHEQLHLPSYITRFGSPMNYDSGRCEHNHKELCKLPSKTAQKRHEGFTKQVGERVTERIVVCRARRVWKLDKSSLLPNTGVNVYRATNFTVHRKERDGAFLEGYYFEKNITGMERYP